MADGSKKSIEKIKKGDIVLSRDAKTGKTAAKRVVRTFEKQVPTTLVLHFKGGQKVETTLDHPFYVEGKGFTAAKELGIGTSIVTRAGPSAILERVERKDALATVYNFEVEDFHTYFVGDGLWVHNNCITLYRGVCSITEKGDTNPAYIDAGLGIAKPRNPRSSVLSEELRAGETDSKWTSWSTSEKVAYNHAKRNGIGVILEYVFQEGSLPFGPYSNMGESEYLYDLPVFGAKVSSSDDPKYPNPFW